MLNAVASQTGISAAWGRIFFLYGPYEHPARLVASVISSLLNNELACCSHGNQIRDFLYVQDVAEAFVALLESNVSGPINIGSGHPVALKDIIRKIAKKVNLQDLVQLGALPTSANEPPLVVADTRRLTKEVNWVPKYDLDQGLEETISWWKNHVCED
jgi:nucleoside-diphosphate-sugar epimerase